MLGLGGLRTKVWGQGLTIFTDFTQVKPKKQTPDTPPGQFHKMLRSNYSKILNIVLIISCVVHVLFILYTNSNPAIPEIILRNKDIRDVNMPLSFILCLRNTNAETESEKYKKAGYNSIQRFFSGTSMYNQSTIGWFGHMENGSTYDSVGGRIWRTNLNCMHTNNNIYLLAT